MKTKSIILSVIFVFALTTYSHSQVGGYLRSKVNRAVNAAENAADKRVNQEIDKKAEEEVNKAADKVEQDIEKNRAENQKEADASKQEGEAGGAGFNLGAMLGGGPVTSKYNQSYSFNNRIYMQAEVYDGKDVVKMDYYIYYSDTSPDAGIESKITGETDEGEQMTMTSTFIYDGANKSFLMLSDMGATKIGMVSDVPEETAAQAGNTPETTITKTGNSRVIAGYKCDEYVIRETGKKEYNKVWLTKDLKLAADKRTLSKAGVSPYFDSPELRGAATLATESFDDKGKLAMKSETREINIGFKHSMSPEGYPLRQMNFNQAGTK